MKEIFVVKMVTGAGYDCHDAGYFKTEEDASEAVIKHIEKNNLEVYREKEISDFDGTSCLKFHVTNKPYFLEFNIFKKELNKLRV
jgi:hypothetical protein